MIERGTNRERRANVWRPASRPPGLRPALMGNFVSLVRRTRDDSLWCAARHGGSAPVYVRWDHAPEVWKRVYDLDDGLTLRHWHFHRVLESWTPADGPHPPHPEPSPHHLIRHSPFAELHQDIPDILAKLDTP